MQLNPGILARKYSQTLASRLLGLVEGTLLGNGKLDGGGKDLGGPCCLLEGPIW